MLFSQGDLKNAISVEKWFIVLPAKRCSFRMITGVSKMKYKVYYKNNILIDKVRSILKALYTEMVRWA